MIAMTDPNTDRTARNPFDVPAEELNDELRQAVQKLWDLPFKDGDLSPGLAVTTARMARLSVLLGRQADITTDKNLRIAEASLRVGKDNLAAQNIVISLTQQLKALTVWLTVLTVVLTILAIVQTWPGLIVFCDFLKSLLP